MRHSDNHPAGTNDNAPAIVGNSGAANDNSAPPAGALRFLSVCSGIEAASCAWPQWHAVAFSEIEKFPSAVLAHHYPYVPNLGDFTKIDTSSLGQVDILCGGTPCQAFSVAGLRRSLDDARGNLSLAFVELAHELAGLGKTVGNGLRNAVWENVVGVLSTKDNAFGCFLAGLVGADGPVVPPGRWTNAGMVSGPKGRAAWRVLDAQYFGVAQRRRRVIVVANFGNGADPAAVLFEPEGLRRYSPPSRETGEGVAPTISARTKGGGGLGTDFDLDGGLVRHAVDVAPCMRAGGNATGGDRPYGTDVDTADSLVAYAFGAQNSANQGDSVSRHITPTLDKSKIPAVTVALRASGGGATAELGGEVATALRASSGGGDKSHVLAFDTYNQALSEEAASLRVSSGMEGVPAVLQSAVRRLTPVECERLQGFPDNYTAIPWRGKPASECPDGPRYKALGNSWAVPLFTWLGRRIDRFMPSVVGNNNRATNTNKDTAIAA